MNDVFCRGPGFWTGSHSSTPKSERVKALSGMTMSGRRLDGRDRVGFSKPPKKDKPKIVKKIKERQKMKVLRDNLLVKELKKEQLGKVIVPDSVPDDYARGKVIKAGPGDIDTSGRRIELDVKEGDVIVFPPPMGGAPGGKYPHVNVDGESLIIIPERLVWAIEE